MLVEILFLIVCYFSGFRTSVDVEPDRKTAALPVPDDGCASSSSETDVGRHNRNSAETDGRATLVFRLGLTVVSSAVPRTVTVKTVGVQ